MSSLQFKLASLDRKHQSERRSVNNKMLRVFYGWAKINKTRKKEAISVIFENDRQRENRTMQFIKRMQETVYVRDQTDTEKCDAECANRMYTEYSIFLSDKQLHGSLELALKVNSEADKNHISEEERIKIADALREHYLTLHRDYKEPIIQSELPFEYDEQ